MRTFIIKLRVDVEDLPLAQREELAKDMQDREENLPGLDDITGESIAELIAYHVSDNEEMFEGSDDFVRITNVKVKKVKERE